MQLTSAIAIAILAYTASAAPYAPAGSQPAGVAQVSGAMPTATASSSSGTSSTVAPAASALPTDIVQRLFTADTAADRFGLLLNDKNFVFDFSDPTKLGNGGRGGDLVAANRKTFPALVGSGSGMAVGTLRGCGFNTPHLHPRATELQIVIEGTVVTEMVPENGVLNADKSRRVIHNTLSKYQMQPFYQGSVHTQFNPNCEPATFIASFNNEDFGTGQVADELFAMDTNVVTAAFGEAFGPEDFLKFKNKIPTSIARGIEECIARCPNV